MALRVLTRIKNINQLLLKSSSCSFSVLSKNYNVLTTKEHEKFIANKNNNCLMSIRHKYDKKKSTGKQIEEDSDDEDEFEDDIDKQKIVKIRVQSMRADLLLKAALGVARNKIEAAFYEGKIRVNGKKILKKSVHCNEGDILEYIKNESATNSDHWNISRLEIMSVKTDGEEFIYVTMKRFKSLTVEKDEMK